MDLAGAGFQAVFRRAIRIATDVERIGSVIFRQASKPFSFSTLEKASRSDVPTVLRFRNDQSCSDAMVGSRSVIKPRYTRTPAMAFFLMVFSPCDSTHLRIGSSTGFLPIMYDLMSSIQAFGSASVCLLSFCTANFSSYTSFTLCFEKSGMPEPSPSSSSSSSASSASPLSAAAAGRGLPMWKVCGLGPASSPLAALNAAQGSCLPPVPSAPVRTVKAPARRVIFFCIWRISSATLPSLVSLSSAFLFTWRTSSTILPNLASVSLVLLFIATVTSCMASSITSHRALVESILKSSSCFRNLSTSATAEPWAASRAAIAASALSLTLEIAVLVIPSLVLSSSLTFSSFFWMMSCVASNLLSSRSASFTSTLKNSLFWSSFSAWSARTLLFSPCHATSCSYLFVSLANALQSSSWDMFTIP